jgi:hypothetical protein
MAEKVIEIGLNTRDIDRAIKEIEKYKQDMLTKLETFRKRLADELSTLAQSGFNGAIMDDLVKGGSRTPEVTVTVKSRGNLSVVIADGSDAVWVEFGSGVYHNGSVGSSPNPEGKRLGFTIGSYGKGYGKGNAWGYYENGELIITRGTPASMPMYNAVKTVIAKAESIAREVWK